MRIGPYEVVRELGRGGMAVVYAARHPNDPRPLAIKVLKRIANERALARFAREAASMARVSHPHVIRIVDVGEAPQGPYIVLEEIEGRTLEAQLQLGPLEPRYAAEVCAQLAAGVGALHREGVLHRDLKPDNVMLRSDGSAVVLDLGLAHEESAETLTRTGQLVGTPAYMSPEQASGQHRQIDERSDVYALGATLFAALSGRAPFSGETLLEVACAVIAGQVEWPEEVPPALAAIGQKAMAKAPSERYPDAPALERDLRAYLAGETPQSTERSSNHLVGAGLVALGGVVLAVLALALGSSWGSEPARPSRAQPTLPEAESPTPRPLPSDPLTGNPVTGNPVKEAAALRSQPEEVRLENTRAWLRRYPQHRLAEQVRRSFLSLKLARGPHEVLGRMEARARFALGPEGRVTGYRFFPGEGEQRRTELLHRRGPGSPLEVLGRLPGDVGSDVIYRPGSSLAALSGSGSRPFRLVDDPGRLRFLERSGAPTVSMWSLAASANYLAVSGFDYGSDAARLSIYRWSDLIQASEVPAPLATTLLRPSTYRKLSFLPGGVLVGIGKPSQRLYRWRVGDEGLEPLPPFTIREGIATIAAHPQREWLAVALKTFQLQIMDPQSGAVLSRLQIATGAERGSSFVTTAQAHNSYPTSAVFSPDGQRLFTTSSGTGSSELRVWNTAGAPATHEEFAAPVLRAAKGSRFLRTRISPDGRWLLTVSRLPPEPGQEPIRKAPVGEPAEYSWDALVEVWDVDEEP